MAALEKIYDLTLRGSEGGKQLPCSRRCFHFPESDREKIAKQTFCNKLNQQILSRQPQASRHNYSGNYYVHFTTIARERGGRKNPQHYEDQMKPLGSSILFCGAWLL